MASLSALWFWHAPLDYRLLVMAFVLFLSVGYFFWLSRHYLKRYPVTLSFQDEDWYLDESKVALDPSTMLTPCYAALCFKDLNQNTYRLIVTQRSFLAPKDYYTLIRFLKTHRGSF